jgi:hypothetical protein
MQVSTLFLAAIVLLWSTDIGLEDVGNPLIPALPSEIKGNIYEASPAKLGQISKPTFKLESTKGIDIVQFLEEFKWQASETGLFGCLNETLPGPKSALYQGVFTESGKLEQLESTSLGGTIPDCAKDIILKMDFPKTAASLSTKRHKIVWRVDW